MGDDSTGTGPEGTGDAVVNAHLVALDGVHDLPAGEQQNVYARLHDALRGALDGEPEAE